MFVDTHCHLHDEAFKCDMELVQEQMNSCGISVAIDMACNLDCAKTGKALSEKYPSNYFGVGFHPSDVDNFIEGDEQKIIEFTSHPKCVAIGEIGLDFYWEGYDKNKQIDLFTRQLDLAIKTNLPVSVHMREATKEVVDILTAYKGKLPATGVLHCYAGSVETAKILLDLGFYISFGGTVTFKNANKILEVAKFVPKDRILTETDCPFLAPHPYRGTRNTPHNIPVIVAKLAELRQTEITALASNIMQNAKTLFYKIK